MKTHLLGSLLLLGSPLLACGSSVPTAAATPAPHAAIAFQTETYPAAGHPILGFSNGASPFAGAASSTRPSGSKSTAPAGSAASAGSPLPAVSPATQPAPAPRPTPPRPAHLFM